MQTATLGWVSIVRLGLVQAALGAIVVLTTSTLNRVMVVELALPATLPGALVGVHYAVQMLRPRWGYGSDITARRTPWIIGGMAVLGGGGFLAAVATAWMSVNLAGGIALAVISFFAIGIGVGAAGTSLLALLAAKVDPGRRAAAATLVWGMMIVGFVVTATSAGHFLDPFSPQRLVAVTGGVSLAAFLVTLAAVFGVEKRVARPDDAHPAGKDGAEEKPAFRQALKEVWSETTARRFTIFIFVSMLAYSAQDLVLEPFAGTVFGMTPGESTKLAGVQHSGVLVGMLLVGALGSNVIGRRIGTMKSWTIGGCFASALALFGLVAAGFWGPGWPIRGSVFFLGAANGAFAVAAIASMMGLAGAGRERREGVRMGLWGAAQGVAFGLGGFLGTVAIDTTRTIFASPVPAYAMVFAIEGVFFVISAWLAYRVDRAGEVISAPLDVTAVGEETLAGLGGR
ncbi:BCD family MFS transporter [Afifella sp. YEN Y35]|uniref:BCD family MFS transporter n=1 Tax=Afifella sp. YEN Y35 TaxID=3388337 RepID=UPI0039E138F6